MRACRYLLLVTLVTSLLSACAKPPKSQVITRNYHFAPGESLVVRDINNVTIQQGRSPGISVTALNLYFPDVTYSKNSLTVSDSNKVIITAPKLDFDRLALRDIQHLQIGAGLRANQLVLKNIHTTQFGPARYINHLIILGGTEINLGSSPVETALFKGENQITLAGIKGSTLNLFAQDNSYIAISGSANTLKATLAGEAKLYAKRFYVNQAFVKAFDKSTAMVTVAKRLFALSTKDALITYYGNPKVYRRALQGSANLPLSKSVYY